LISLLPDRNSLFRSPGNSTGNPMRAWASRADEAARPPRIHSFPCIFPIDQGIHQQRLVPSRLRHPPTGPARQRYFSVVGELCRNSADEFPPEGTRDARSAAVAAGISRFSLCEQIARSPLPHLHSIVLDGFRRKESDALRPWTNTCLPGSMEGDAVFMRTGSSRVRENT
jgi:hypothetical protein